VDYSRRDRADALAAQYVTGTLRGAARRRFETLLPAHPALHRAVLEWQARLAPLTLSVDPVQPSPQVWQRIEARIGAKSARAAVPAPRGALSWIGGWRALAGLATAASIGLGLLLVLPQPVLPPVVVVLGATDAAGGAAVPVPFVASISGDGRSLVTRPLVNVAMEPGRTLELWAVPGSGAPRSLGLISPNLPTVLQKGDALQGAAALAVSLEPAGGSPTGAPTGPVLYVGKLTP
jgi:anti-sigma-K factor RskA